jgi:hypothetical protein
MVEKASPRYKHRKGYMLEAFEDVPINADVVIKKANRGLFTIAIVNENMREVDNVPPKLVAIPDSVAGLGHNAPALPIDGKWKNRGHRNQ